MKTKWVCSERKLRTIRWKKCGLQRKRQTSNSKNGCKIKKISGKQNLKKLNKKFRIWTKRIGSKSRMRKSDWKQGWESRSGRSWKWTSPMSWNRTSSSSCRILKDNTKVRLESFKRSFAEKRHKMERASLHKNTKRRHILNKHRPTPLLNCKQRIRWTMNNCQSCAKKLTRSKNNTMKSWKNKSTKVHLKLHQKIWKYQRMRW